MSKESRARQRQLRKDVVQLYAANEAAFKRSKDMRRRGLDPSQDDNPAVHRVNGADGSGTTFFAAFFRP